METALTPMEFSRRAKNLYADREAVVDGDLRFSYAEFLERCDRWSHALQKLGVKQGDRVAYIAPNTHSHLEGYYAVPRSEPFWSRSITASSPVTSNTSSITVEQKSSAPIRITWMPLMKSGDS